MERVAQKEEDIQERRQRIVNKILNISSDAISSIGNLMSTLYEGDIDKIEKEQDANEDAYNADIERIEALAESGAISEEEAEARKRAAEDKTSKKNEELEKKKLNCSRSRRSGIRQYRLHRPV